MHKYTILVQRAPKLMCLHIVPLKEYSSSDVLGETILALPGDNVASMDYHKWFMAE